MHSVIRKLALESNQSLPLVDYLIPLVEDKKEIKIVDIGSGPYPRTGQYLEGVKIEIHHCDKQDFSGFWRDLGETPLFLIQQQNMEKLTYPDNYFDIVHCVNTLDHTIDALAALKEMIRVCKPGGWVYIDCNLDQLSTGHKHYWSAQENGSFVNSKGNFDLKDYGFSIKLIDHHTGQRHDNQIIAKLRKSND